MAEIDPLVAEILLKGDDEFLASLKKVGEEAAESFEKLSKSIETTGGTFANVASGLHLIEAALAGVTAATILFIEQQTELSQNTKLLADAFGTTGEQLQNIEQIFASSGVKVEQFERFAVRLTTTIAREWPVIAESIRTYANENDASTLRVSNAILRVQDAQKNLSDHSEERASQMVKDNLSVEQSYIKLQFSAQKAASEQLGALQSVRGAELSEAAALQHLATLEGRPPSAAEKHNLELAQAQQAIDQTRKATADARIAQQEKAASAALKQAQQEQEYADLRRKAAKDARDDAEQRVKDENAIKEAVIARGEAEERNYKFTQSSVGSIKGALDEIVKGNKDVSSQVNLTEVSVENLRKGLFALAQETSKNTPPTGIDALRAAAKLFASDTEHQISTQQRLALVTRLAGSSFASLGHSAAEILNVIEHNSDAFEKLAKKAEDLHGGIDADAQKIEDFRGKLAQFQLTISQLSQSFAAAISPAFTAFLEALDKSIASNDGLIHNFISGIVALGQAISALGSSVVTVADTVAKFINLISGNTLKLDGWAVIKGIIAGISVVILAQLGPIGLVVAAVIGLVGFIGALRDHWKDVSEWVEKHRGLVAGVATTLAIVIAAFAPWTVAIGLVGAAVVLLVEHWDDVKKAVTDSAVFKWCTDFIDNLKAIYDWFGRLKQAAPKWLGGGGGASPSSPSSSAAGSPGTSTTGTEAPIKGYASGGLVGDDDALMRSGALTQGSTSDIYLAYQQRRKALLKKQHPDYEQGGWTYTWDEEEETYVRKADAKKTQDMYNEVAQYAGGGKVKGPGSGTSDSIFARLSNGEFVVKAKAVQAYGAGLFHALNNMQLPGFAAGGLVASPVRMGGGGGIIPASSTLNLSIDGRSFNGLRGPKSTIDDLSSFAIARQTSAAGSNPSWMK